MGVFWAKPAAPEQRMRIFAPSIATSGSYADVDLSRPETSMQAVAVRSAVDLISSLSSELPMDVFSGHGAGRREVTRPDHLDDPDGTGYGLEDWCYRVIVSWLLRGNVYGEVLDRSPLGYATQIEIFFPDDVSGFVDDQGVVHWFLVGREIDSRRFVHRRVNPLPGRVTGLSPIEAHAETIGLSLSSTRFGRQWFTDGAHPGGLLTNSEVALDGEQVRTARDRFMAALRGRSEPAVLGKGWAYQQLQLNPEESQFLGTQGYSAAECARIFGPGIAEILGYESGGSLTYANVESRSAHLLVYAMNKWLRRLERLLSSMLPRTQYVKIDRAALLESTTLERYRANELALRNRWKTVNEVREDEDMPPVPWGDEPNTTGAQAGQGDNEPTGAEAPQPGGTGGN